MIPEHIRNTSDDKLAGVVRLLLATIFVMTGVMKLVVPMLAEAWSGQLLAANLPFYSLTRWTVPFVEIGVGVVLTVGVYSRLASVIVIGIMVPATYVHLVVDDPNLFPLQPSEPIIPLVVMLMSAYIIWRGAGAWSSDQEVRSDSVLRIDAERTVLLARTASLLEPDKLPGLRSCWPSGRLIRLRGRQTRIYTFNFKSKEQ